MAPVFAELLSGTQPPKKFFELLSLLMHFAFYSCGVVLARELLVRWKKGWPTLLVLGAAYALLEEGLMTKAFFNPAWPDVGPASAYGRLAGVNWTLVFRLIIFHSVLSISIPVVLAHFMAPKRRGEPWMNGWFLLFFAALLGAGTAFGYIFLQEYRPPHLQYSLGWVVFFLLIALARRLPREPFKPLDHPHVSRWWFLLLGFLAPILYVVIGFALPGSGKIPAWTAPVLLIGFTGLVLWLVLKLSGNCGVWKARQRFALPAGVLMFFSIFMLMNEEHQGKKLVGLAGLVFVIAMTRQARRVEEFEEGSPAQPYPQATSTRIKPVKQFLPVVALLLMAPIFGELFSGCQTPQQFFLKNLSCILAVCFYGSGAVLVRELLVRWNKGWPSLLVLGAAYAILEEGLAAKYFFDPACPFLEPNPAYGRLAGVNWVFTFRVIVFHAIFSISIPVMLAHLMFHKRRQEPWINKWGFTFLTALLLAVTAFIFFVATPYRPPLIHYSLAWIVFFLLLVLARRLPREPFKPLGWPRVSAWWFLLLGFLATILYILFGFILPNISKVPSGVALLLMAGLVGLVFWLVLKLSGNRGVLTTRQRFALATGIMMFYILFLPFNELISKGNPNHRGKALVGLAGLVFVIAMARQARRVERLEEGLLEAGPDHSGP